MKNYKVIFPNGGSDIIKADELWVRDDVIHLLRVPSQCSYSVTVAAFPVTSNVLVYETGTLNNNENETNRHNTK